jgi:SPW repeat
MTSQSINTNKTRVNASAGLTAAKASSTICLLAGIWLFVSPWVYGAYTNNSAWNSWIAGGFIVLFGIIRILRPAYSTVLAWCNMILGIWVFCSPWIYGYARTNGGRFINSLCVGVIVFIFSISSARASWNRNAPVIERRSTEAGNAAGQNR